MRLNNKNCMIKMIVLILTIIPLTIDPSDAWNSGHGKTHEFIATKIYGDMPASIQKNLDLSEMKRGADYPDTLDAGKKYRHSYPASVDFAQKNLERAMDDYRNAKNAKTTGDRKNLYKQESFHLGMASHYISDTFTAPHTIHRMENYDKYYKIADEITDIKGTKLPQNIWNLNMKSHNGLDSLLKYGKDEGNKDAIYWNEKQIWKHRQAAYDLAKSNLKLSYAGTLAIFKQWLRF